MSSDENDRQNHLLQVLEGLDRRLHELISDPPRTREELAPVPTVPAIYLLSEDGIPLYAGRTQDLRQRLGDHMLPGGDRSVATFAFRLARESAPARGIEVGRPNADLERDESFQDVFSEAKSRVAAMGVQFLEVPDPIEQTFLEVYVAESLATPYNHWQTTHGFPTL